MRYDYYYKHINKNTKGKYDCSTLAARPEVFSRLIDDLIRPFRKTAYDLIVSQEALGLIFGSAAALKTKKGFIPLRKGGKLPTVRTLVARKSFVDYSGKMKALEINKGLIKKDVKVLIVDDWIETGAQMKAAILLIESQGGKVVGIAAITAHRNRGTNLLFEKYNLRPLNVIEE
ncbi:TPA: adenine phosphoribosyltransferase [Candidatus Woesearchaeota archaeon]|nr:adenine phosphoribosyltransferase [Candidatus Woesearchaeota archaeon]